MNYYLTIKKNLKPTEVHTLHGTTPRQITDLLGSLCDLTSGSGDKGTPIILIQGYFDNYSDN
uniref:coenzyme F420-0:L-glutamate ligase n=1 Tax=uncultured Anaerococcus sp. TaxID=293428 RepID=UPI002803A0FE